jgi:hypothetical protein
MSNKKKKKEEKISMNNKKKERRKKKSQKVIEILIFRDMTLRHINSMHIHSNK